MNSIDINIKLHILNLIDSLPFYVLLVDEYHHIILANKAVQTHLGLGPEEIVGKYCPKVVHGIDGPFHGCPLEESLKMSKAVEREVFDEISGRWIISAIYPTGAFTRDRRKIFFHMVTDITERKKAEEQLKVSRERLRSLSKHLESVREEERKKIAHDLHDETSQVVASLNAYLEAAISKLPANSNDARVLLKKAQSCSAQILDQLHRMILELRPTILDDLGLVAAARWLADNIMGAAGVTVNFKTLGRERRLSPQLEATLFRVIQEAVTNIARHAHAKNARVSLHFKKSAIEVHVGDDGRGFDVDEAISSKDRPRGLGLLGMKERVELTNGTLSIRSHPSSDGTRIDIKIPLNYKEVSDG